MSPPPFVWLITGCSSGMERALTIAALERGDNVIATARSKSSHTLKDLKGLGAHTMELDVTSSLGSLKEIAAEAVKVHGHIDVVVNNAGFAIIGSLEETSEHEDMLSQFNPLPFTGMYAASKFTVRGISDSLHEEISPLGLRSVCFELGYFRTAALDNLQKRNPVIDEYQKVAEGLDAALAEANGNQRGDPARGANVIIDIVKGEAIAAGKKIPRLFVLGPDCCEKVKEYCENTLVRLEEWESASSSTDYRN